MKKFKHIIRNSLFVGVLLAFSGCNSWLDINPVGVQTSDTYWQTKEEAEQVLTGAYVQLRKCVPVFFRWGELRTNELDFGMIHNMGTDQTTQDERSLRQLEILPTNVVCDWSEVYTVIGRANAVITLAPKALETDITFSEQLCNSYIAEAVFLRSLCYFYLVRTFRDVPYITSPYTDDTQEFNVGVTDGNEILNQVVRDLEVYVKKCKPGYEVEWQTKGRATCWAFYALMADIYLWQERYSDVHNVYQILKNSGFKLEDKKDYWTIFYPGNNKKESIFELQYRGNLTKQENVIYGWFTTKSSQTDARYVISESSKKLFEDNPAEDIRGKEYMYDNRYIGEKYWKYLGTKSRHGASYPDSDLRPENDRAPNWIFYRFSDIVLMEAEAMVMDGTPYNKVCEFLDSTICKRAGYTEPLTVPESEEEMLSLILDERQKEFLAEGKQWFDVLRVGRKQNYKYRSFIIQALTRFVASKDKPMWKVKLEDEYGHYLPILRSEIEASQGKLVQNPFYKNVE